MTEKFTSRDYVEAFASNNKIDEWVSVNGILNDDTFDVYRDDDHDPGIIVDCMEKIQITDPENMRIRYRV